MEPAPALPPPSRAKARLAAGTNVYFVDSDARTVNKCAKTGCGGTPTALATMQGRPQDVAVDATDVYWTDFDNGTVLKCAIAGCNDMPTVVASGQTSVIGIAVDATAIYWTTSGASVMKMAK